MAVETLMTTPPFPAGSYATIVCDPPWAYTDKIHAKRVELAKQGATTSGRMGAEGHYPTLTIGELVDLPVASLAAENAHLWLWTTNAFMEQAHLVAQAWGFIPKTILTWGKARVGDGKLVNQIGMGSYLRNNTEHCVFAVKGRLRLLSKSTPTLFLAPRGEHSSKPEKFFEIVESVSPEPRIELFARGHRSGWASWGLEAEQRLSYADILKQEDQCE